MIQNQANGDYNTANSTAKPSSKQVAMPSTGKPNRFHQFVGQMQKRNSISREPTNAPKTSSSKRPETLGTMSHELTHRDRNVSRDNTSRQDQHHEYFTNAHIKQRYQQHLAKNDYINTKVTSRGSGLSGFRNTTHMTFYNEMSQT